MQRLGARRLLLPCPRSLRDGAPSPPRPAFSPGDRLLHGCAGIFPGSGAARSIRDGSPLPLRTIFSSQNRRLHCCGRVFPCAGAARLLVPQIFPTVSSTPWRIQKRFMGGAKKSMARARKNFAKKVRKQIRAKQLSQRPKIAALDVHLRRETRMRMVWNVKLILASRDGHVIPSTEFTRLARDLGFPKAKLFADFVNSFPGVFKISSDQEDRRVRWLEFTEKAELLIDQEEKVMREYHEPLIVRNLRKILMMVPAHRVLLTKLSHIRSSLWMPDNFKTAILPKYPQYFTVTGAYLELAAYDKALAVTTRELNQRMKGGGKAGDRDKYSFRICVEPHTVLHRSILKRILSFQRLPFPSPYEAVAELDLRSMEGQKRVVAIFHEFLSLTVEKKAYVDHVGFFTRDLGLPQKLEDMLCRFPHIFYVSMRGDRHVVFLKEYYRKGQLIEKHPLFTIKQEFGRLMDFRVFRESRPREVRGICAESFVAPRQPVSETGWSFPFPPAPQGCALQTRQGDVSQAKVAEVVEAATVVDPVKGANAPLTNGANPRSRAVILKKLGLFSDDEKSDEEGRQSVAPATAVEDRVPDSEIFLQLGFDDEDESPKDVSVTPGKQPSLGAKLGFCSDDENSDDERRQVSIGGGGGGDSWSWKALQPSPQEEPPLERKRKKRVSKPFWEKKPFDGFNDPFF
ncbi:hypothetical protein SELMODRAFT_451377 [Selaginella moellendorffii]|uniref:Uncharacterized protein RPD1L3-2 n=1 Tax=Selaginella moellendorffii TaxID=88036 RepID=D8RZH8_SELML|nr:hypothetical protein SELMODRAFT_451377 [Selaginella moellendorffii]